MIINQARFSRIEFGTGYLTLKKHYNQMKFQMKFLVFLFVVFTLGSCSQKESEKELMEDAGLRFALDSLVKESCVGENCAVVNFRWPVASGSESAENINRVIYERLSSFIGMEENAGPLDLAVQRFFKSFGEFKAEFPDSYGGWEISVSGELSHKSEKTVSLEFTWMSFLGGAHPNHGQVFLNFDPGSGDFLGVDRLVLDQARLLVLAEKKFREFHQVAEGVTLEQDGRFFLPETGFFLPGAMGFKEGKFWMVYIPYEIGPYAMGYTELEFSREELGNAVRW
jgi:hypothetical protein